METLRDKLARCGFLPRLKAKTKNDVLRELIDLLVTCGSVKAEHRDDVLASLVEREGKMSTGMQLGVAIPHAKSDKVERLATAVAISEGGVDFDSLDGAPSHIFVATISPATDVGGHIRFLADVSRQLSSRSVREKILSAKSREEMISALCGGE